MKRTGRFALALARVALLFATACSPDAGPESAASNTEPAPPKQTPTRSASPKNAPAPALPSILLVTFDTTRADHIGAYGHAAAQTPTLDRLASEGVLFERALAPTPLTLPSHASILTGLFPQAHGVHDNALYELSRDVVSVTEVFRERGWRTGAFVSSVILNPSYGLNQGFEVYRGVTGITSESSSLHERIAADVVDDAISWLSGLEASDRFFGWVHFYDPHYEYSPPKSERSGSDPYDAEIAYADVQLGRLLRFLESRGRAENLLIVATADHGESLGEHGEQTHAIFIYQATIRVPLIWWGRRITEPAGTRVASTVSNVAVAASLLALAGVPADTMPGSEESLFTPDGKLAPSGLQSAVLLESHFPYNSHRWRALRGLVIGSQKLIDGVTPELYDLESDAEEQNDLSGADPAGAADLLARLEAEFASRTGVGSNERHMPGAEERAQLAALGYAVGSAGGDPLQPGLPDPRDRIGDKKLSLEGLRLLREASELKQQAAHRPASQAAEFSRQARLKLERAHAMLSQIVKANPRDVFAVARLGITEGELENFATAIELLERASRDEPRQPWIHANLARVYANAGRDADAARHMQQAIAMGPFEPMNYEWLIDYYTRQNELAAVRHWLEALIQAVVPGSSEQRAAMRRLEALDAA